MDLITKQQTNPVFIVTGASRGYGLAIVHELFSLVPGCRVLATARSSDLLLALSDSIVKRNLLENNNNNNIKFVSGDLCDPEIVSKIIETAQKEWGRIDAIVHNAGVVLPIGKQSEVKIDDTKNMFEINLFSAMRLTQCALPLLRQSKGRVIMVSSLCAKVAFSTMGSYCISKAALNMYSKCLAVEEPDIISIVLQPGVLNTEMQSELRKKGEEKQLDSDLHKYFKSLFDSNSLVDPRKSASVVAKLCMYASKELSGKVLDWEDYCNDNNNNKSIKQYI